MSPEERRLREIYAEFYRDHAAFARECLAIRDKFGDVVPFILQPAQIKLNELIQRIRAKRRPVRIIVLKARQVMVSSGTAAHFFQQCAFDKGQKALIVAHERDAAKNIFGYYQQLQRNYQPFRGVIDTLACTKNIAQELEWEGGGYVHVATAENVKTGRSFSLRHLHLSEFAFWRDAKTLMTGLMQSVPDDADTTVIIESTANGVGGEFHRLWKEANDPAIDTEWVPLFFAWHEHPQNTVRLTDPEAALLDRTLSQNEMDLRARYSLTLGQLAWRRWAVRNKCGGSEDVFRQEYPGCPEEAFLASGRPRFSLQHLGRMPAAARDAGGTAGELEEIQNGPKRIITFLPSERGAVVLYKKPSAGKEYIIGVDIAEGIDLFDGAGHSDPDFSVAQVVDRSTGEQVAKLKGRIEPAAFAEYTNALARWYNWAYVVPEANGPGIAFLDQLIRDNYPPSLIYHRRPEADEQFAANDSTLLSKIGWKTTATTRLHLISRHDQAIREFSIIINDPVTLAEHQSFVINAKGKPEGADGEHDDEVIALALAVIGIEAAPADRTIAGIKKLAPPRERIVPPGAVSRIRTRRLRETRPERRSDSIRF